MGKQEKIQALVNAVVELLLATGKDATVKEIAEKLQWSENVVRATLRDAPGGCPNELDWSEDTRPSYSRNYRNMESGVHKVNVYAPSRQTLRKLILATRETIKSQGDV